MSLLDIFSKISSIIIASFSLFFTVFIFYHQSKRSRINTDDQRKRDSVKTIIFEHNLSWLFKFFDNVQTEVTYLNKDILNDSQKNTLNDNLQDELKSLRLKFTDLLLAVDKSLYEEVKSLLDELLDELTVTMFNESILLTEDSVFENEIISVISKYKTNVIKSLYEFNKG